MEILFKNKNMIAVNKAVGVPSERDLTEDLDAMTMTAEILRNENENDSLWLVHRLDRVVGGVLVFARNKNFAAKLSALFSDHDADKEYLAVVEGEVFGGVLTDFIYKDSRLGKAFVTNRSRSGVKDASLEYISLAHATTEKGTYTLVRIKLHTGRFHQIRVQFASRSTPLVGDGKYGSRDKGAKFPSLFAFHLGFSVDGKRNDIYKLPDVELYPWNLFDFEVYKNLK